MKKRYKSILIYFLFFLLLILGIIFSILQDQKRHLDLIFYTIPQSNSYVLDSENREINFLLYANQDNCLYFNKDYIRKLELTTLTETYPLTLEEVSIKSDKAIIENEEYFAYQFYAKFPFEEESFLTLHECYARFSYANGSTLQFKLGDLALLQVESRKNFLVRRMMGVTTALDQAEGIGGVFLSLSNLTSEAVTLKKCTLISPNAKTNYHQLKELATNSFDYHTPIEEIINDDYNYLRDFEETSCSIQFEEEEVKHLFIPFTYLSNDALTTIGFDLEYQIGSATYHQIIPPILLFESSNQILIGEKLIYDAN